jgi:glycosyltransferase involved in cell wall biosynthesis
LNTLKHLLIISYPFPPNSSAGAVRSRRFAQYLAELGWRVSVITIKPFQVNSIDTEELNRLSDSIDVHFTSTVDPWLYLRQKAPRFILSRIARSLLMRIFSFPDHMLLWVPFAVREGLSINKKTPFSVIYTTSPPHSTHLAGLILKWITGKPWIADFRDPWTLNAFHRKGRIDNVLLGIEKLLEKKVLSNASCILANTTANRNNLLAAFPDLSSKKVVHIPNGWEEFTYKVDSSKRDDGALNIVHAGIFYPLFKPYALLHALASWRKGNRPPGIPPLNGQSIRLILLGAKENEANIVKDLGLEDIVEVKSWVPQTEAQRIMSQADMLWVTLGTGKESSTYVPSKIFEYIAARKPIIAFFPEGDAAELIRKTNSGSVFTSDDQAPIIRFLAEASNDYEKFSSRYYQDERTLDMYHVRYAVSQLNAKLETLAGPNNL